jgi:hypothetical protein
MWPPRSRQQSGGGRGGRPGPVGPGRQPAAAGHGPLALLAVLLALVLVLPTKRRRPGLLRVTQPAQLHQTPPDGRRLCRRLLDTSPHSSSNPVPHPTALLHPQPPIPHSPPATGGHRRAARAHGARDGGLAASHPGDSEGPVEAQLIRVSCFASWRRRHAVTRMGRRASPGLRAASDGPTGLLRRLPRLRADSPPAKRATTHSSMSAAGPGPGGARVRAWRAGPGGSWDRWCPRWVSRAVQVAVRYLRVGMCG